MKRFAYPAADLPPYSAAALQLLADGLTTELSAIYLGSDVEFVEGVLELARRQLDADTLEHAVAIAMCRGWVV